MKNLVFFLLFLGLVLLSCSDGVNSPNNPDDPNDDVFNLENCNCQPPIDDDNYIPVDCYDWGKRAWSGDDQNGDYHAIQGWFQAVTLDPNVAPNNDWVIEIKYAVLVSRDRATQKDTIVALLNYNGSSRSLNTNEGGLFSRWYQDNSFSAMKNSLIDNGVLKIYPGSFPDRVSHWWMHSSGKYRREANKDYRIICRVRITGNIALQIAADYYKEVSSNYPDNKEAWHSSWIGQTNGKFVTYYFPNL